MHVITVCFQAPQVDVGSGHPCPSSYELPMGLWAPADQVGVGFIAHEGIEPISHHHIALPITQHVHLLADTMWDHLWVEEQKVVIGWWAVLWLTFLVHLFLPWGSKWCHDGLLCFYCFCGWFICFLDSFLHSPFLHVFITLRYFIFIAPLLYHILSSKDLLRLFLLWELSLFCVWALFCVFYCG